MIAAAAERWQRLLRDVVFERNPLELENHGIYRVWAAADIYVLVRGPGIPAAEHQGAHVGLDGAIGEDAKPCRRMARDGPAVADLVAGGAVALL